MYKMDRTSANKFFFQNITIFILDIILILVLIKIFKISIIGIIIIEIIGFIIFTYKRKRYISNLNTLAYVDSLTKIYNYNYFEYKLNKFLHMKDYNKILSVMFIDIDCFKDYNSINGCLNGNLVLQELAKILKIIENDNYIAIRYGGGKFALILKDTTKEDALIVSQNIKERFSQKSFSNKIFKDKNELTLSIGIAEFPKEAKSYLEIIDACNDSLNKDKISNKIGHECYNDLLNHLQNELKEENTEIIITIKTLISVIDAKDKYTYGHVQRVVNYANIMANDLNLPIEERKKLIYGAYIHDIGKIAINKEILMKKMPLNDSEWQEIRKHPKYGYDMINKIKCLKGVQDLVLYHHERYDGKGYPKGLKGKDIPYLARILVILDSFDAMTTARCYNKPKSYKEGIEELNRCSGTQFDPKFVEIFSKIIENKIINKNEVI